MVYAVIMAGGIGSRFWPQSRKKRPKQFIRVLGELTLIQNTVARMQGLVPPERCYVVTNADYVEQTRDQLPGVPAGNILAEPIGRNTAPCIAYAAFKIAAEDPDATMIVLPADHIVKNVRTYHQVLQTAIDKAETPGALVTIGITPTHPETGYGYIQFDGQVDPSAETQRAYPVLTFAEKPDPATAERFLDSGDFLWNSGMFIWKARTIIEQMQAHCPEVYEAFRILEGAVGAPEEDAAVGAAYQNTPRISIDYGVMEKAENVFVVPGSFGWSDVGDWRAVYDISDKNNLGNSLTGNVIAHDSSRCLVQSGERLVVLVGIHDVVVVDTSDAVLVCHRESAQQVKNIVDYMHAHQMERFI